MMLAMTLTGRPIEIRYSANLHDTAGNPAHAASFIRQRVIILDGELRADRRERERILVHELHHFVWVRLANGERRSWEDLLLSEWSGNARGEAGWSAEWRKDRLIANGVVAARASGASIAARPSAIRRHVLKPA